MGKSLGLQWVSSFTLYTVSSSGGQPEGGLPPPPPPPAPAAAASPAEAASSARHSATRDSHREGATLFLGGAMVVAVGLFQGKVGVKTRGLGGVGGQTGVGGSGSTTGQVTGQLWLRLWGAVASGTPSHCPCPVCCYLRYGSGISGGRWKRTCYFPSFSLSLLILLLLLKFYRFHLLFRAYFPSECQSPQKGSYDSGFPPSGRQITTFR